MQFQIYKSSLALIKLAQKVQFKPQMRPVCLPQHGVSVDEVSGQNCYITGEWIYLMNKKINKFLIEIKCPYLHKRYNVIFEDGEISFYFTPCEALF